MLHRFAPVNLDKKADGPDFAEVVDALAEDDQQRVDFLKACLIKLGLTVNEDDSSVPSLSRLHLSSMESSALSAFLERLKDAIVVEDGEEYLKGENDVFHFQRPSAWSTGPLRNALPKDEKEKTDDGTMSSDINLDYENVVKHIMLHEEEYPASKETPYFNHHAFYSNLKYYQLMKNIPGEFGRWLLYGEVVTSTSTMLEKCASTTTLLKADGLIAFRNSKLLHAVPNGFTATATVQVAGRGRGSNVWVSPMGSLMFSTCIRHPAEAMGRAPVVFIQYITAMAIVEGIKSYDYGYRELPIKLKWPNDICEFFSSDYQQILALLTGKHRCPRPQQTK